MTFKVKSGINVGSIPIIDQDAKYQQVLSTPNVRPTLNFDFLNSQSIDSRVTYTRASSASYISQDGLIAYSSNNTPRFDFDPSTGVPEGMIVEGQGYNLFNNTDVGGYAGAGTNLKEFTNALIAPDGNMSASIFASDTSSNVTKYWYRPAGTSTTNSNYTFSIFVKYIDEPNIYLRVNDQTGGNGGQIGFNIQTGQVIGGSSSGSVTRSSITPYGNGWYRLHLACYVTAAITQIHGTIFLNALGNTTAVSSVGVWGWQMELLDSSKAYPSSYIASNNVFTSRASLASYRDSVDGLIKYAGYNLITNNVTTGSGVNVAVQNNALVAPDGTTTGAIGTINSTAHAMAYYGVTVTASTTYTFSFYAQRGTATSLNYSVYNVTAGNDIVASTNYIASVPSTGWGRISVTFTTPVGCTSVNVYPARDGTSLGTFGFWGAQLEVGSSATLVSKTTGTASAAVRYHYSQDTVQSRPMLEYYPATNQITYSEAISAYGGGGSSGTANAMTAPNGVLSGTKIVEDTTNTRHQKGVIAYGTFTANTPVTGSIFLKAAERTRAFVWVGMSGAPYTRAGITIDLDTGAWSNNNVGTPQSAVRSVTPYANGWFRVMITTIADPTITSAYMEFGPMDSANSSTYLGDGTSGIYAWGTQMEFSANGSSYIPTNGATATRAADVYTSAQTTRIADGVNINNKDWFNSNEGTFVVDYDSWNYNNAPFIVKGNNAEYATGRNSNGAGTWNGTSQIDAPVTGANSVTGSSFAISWNAAGRAMSLNGNTANVGVGTFTPSYTFQLGSDGAGNRAIDGHIKRVVYYPLAASNTQLQALSILT